MNFGTQGLHLPYFGNFCFGQSVKRPFFDKYIESKTFKISNVKNADCELFVEHHTNNHALRKCFGLYNIRLQHSHVFMKQNSADTLNTEYMWGFGMINDMLGNKYCTKRPDGAKGGYNKPIGFTELLNNVAYLWGVHFIDHCVSLCGSKYKIVPMKDIKE